ncbi:MAG: hypothetical protein Q7T55_16875 [Solirubrobacteraceae bacterium]|nr:hypothetical protein [Solirubrobacteraceae bacterium]
MLSPSSLEAPVPVSAAVRYDALLYGGGGTVCVLVGLALLGYALFTWRGPHDAKRDLHMTLSAVAGVAVLGFGGLALSARGTIVVDTTVTRVESVSTGKGGRDDYFYDADGRKVGVQSHTAKALKVGRRVRCRVHRSSVSGVRLGECVLDPAPDWVVVDPAVRERLDGLLTNRTRGAAQAYADLYASAKREYRQDLP